LDRLVRTNQGGLKYALGIHGVHRESSGSRVEEKAYEN
jgi:hypothetical protein